MLFWLDEEKARAIKENPQGALQKLKSLENSDDYFEKAMVLDQLGEQQSTLQALRVALQKNIQHLPSLYAIALKSIQKAQEKEAKSYLKRALRVDPKAADHAILFQRELKFTLSQFEKSSVWSLWLLKELSALKKATRETQFLLGKLLFEQSKFEESIPYLLEAVQSESMAAEATEYLSYVYEHLYRGDDLVLKTLELAEKIKDRSDLFFNLAMVCQHEQRRMELALHFFYLAAREDPHDPGLRFALEQAALEYISEIQSKPKKDAFQLMLAHLYQGSLGVAERYAKDLKFKFPDSFEGRFPAPLWDRWLVPDEGVLGQALRNWFGETKPAPKRARVHKL